MQHQLLVSYLSLLQEQQQKKLYNITSWISNSSFCVYCKLCFFCLFWPCRRAIPSSDEQRYNTNCKCCSMSLFLEATKTMDFLCKNGTTIYDSQVLTTATNCVCTDCEKWSPSYLSRNITQTNLSQEIIYNFEQHLATLQLHLVQPYHNNCLTT